MINVSDLGIRLGSFVLKNVNLEVGDGECLTLVGPNGSGKTTLLECIAGLHRPHEGKIAINGIEVTDLPPEKRGVGYVPQDHVLFPHLTANQNVAFGLRNGRDLDKATNVMRWLGIGHLVGRNVRTLSAGERQKVALARALAVNPKALLLDEPLSALDPLARAELRRELKNILPEILHTMNLQVIYVTHDLYEAEVMGDHIAVMNNGRVEEVGSKEKVFENPSSKFVAEFLGYNAFDGRIRSLTDGVAIIEVKDLTIKAEVNRSDLSKDVTVILRPQDILISNDSQIRRTMWQHCQCNIIEGTVKEVCEIGALAEITVDAGIFLKSKLSIDLLDELNLRIGSKVFMQFKTSKTKLIPKRDLELTLKDACSSIKLQV